MKKKMYQTPEMTTFMMDTTPLMAGSPDPIYGGGGGGGKAFARDLEDFDIEEELLGLPSVPEF